MAGGQGPLPVLVLAFAQQQSDHALVFSAGGQQQPFSGGWVVFTIGVEEATQRQSCVEDSLARDSGWVAGVTDSRTVNLVGGRGYTGSELLGLIAGHPQLELGIASSRSEAGQTLSSVCAAWPEDGRTFTQLEPEGVAAHPADAWVLALPNGLAANWVEAIRAGFPESVILDLSADYRFDTQWTYGLPERFRDEIRNARLIANPGCYATGAQLGLLPLADLLRSDPLIFGVSGYSGAGKTPSPRNDPEVLKDNLIPYALSGHVHEKEISHQLHTAVRFMPHVAAFFRGISLTIAFELDHPIIGG